MGNTKPVGTTDTGVAEVSETDPAAGTTDNRPTGGTPETGGSSTDDGQASTDDGQATTDDGQATTDDGQATTDDGQAGDDVEALTADRDKWRALARKNEDRAKANAAAAQALKDVEAERDALKADNEARGSREGDLEAENSRLLAALKHGLADSDLRFLKGVPADEIDAAAADLAARVGRHSGGRERFLGRETPPGSGPGAGGDFLRQAMTARNI